MRHCIIRWNPSSRPGLTHIHVAVGKRWLHKNASHRQTTRNKPRGHMNPTQIARASITVYQTPLLSVQYCSAILLLRSSSTLLNPFHPLLRTALSKHEEAHEVGYYFHMHTSSKLTTGKEASMRRNIRVKIKAAWDEVMSGQGYDVKTGIFIGHLAKDWDPTRQVRGQDIKGTVSLVPTEMCLRAPFKDLLADCERGIEAVKNCKTRNFMMEDMMQPWSLWRYYDWRRRLLLKKYTELGYGLSIGGHAAARFQLALKELRSENGKKYVGKDGEYLVDVDGETYDVAPLRRDQGRKKKGFMIPQQEADDEDYDDSLPKMREHTPKIYGDLNSGKAKPDLDWGLDDLDSEGVDKPSAKKASKHKNLEPKWEDDGF